MDTLSHITPAGASPRHGPCASNATATTTRIRVAIQSSSAITGLGVRAVLSRFPGRVEVSDVDRSGTFGGADVVVWDVALLDRDLRDRALLRGLVRHSCAVVAIAPDFRPDLTNRALQLGVDACVSLDVTGADLMDVLEAAARGDHGVDRWRSLAALHSGSIAGLGVGLTDREQEIVMKIADGLTNQEIAEILCLSMNTIKTYIRTAYRKMGVSTRSQAVLWAIRYDGTRSADPAPLAMGQG